MRFPFLRTFFGPPRFVGLSLLGFVGLAACNDILGIGDPTPANSTNSGGNSTNSTTTEGGGGAAGEGGTTTGQGGVGGNTTSSTSTPCDAATKVLIVKEDACLFMGACNGSIASGNSTYANLGFGRCVLRFLLPDEVAAAFENDRVTLAELTISREYNCGTDCMLKTPGPLEARPLRNDWIEGTGDPYGGVDYCRRTTGNPGDQWDKAGAEGPKDVPPGRPSGTTTVADEDTEVVIQLDPTPHKEWIGPGLDGMTSLSVRVMRPTNSATVFIMSTHEGATNPSLVSQLAVTYCK